MLNISKRTKINNNKNIYKDKAIINSSSKL